MIMARGAIITTEGGGRANITALTQLHSRGAKICVCVVYLIEREGACARVFIVLRAVAARAPARNKTARVCVHCSLLG